MSKFITEETIEKPAKVMKPGFFNIDILNAVCAERDLTKAKQIALDAITAQPHATKANIEKTTGMVSRAKNLLALATVVTNNMLAHPSEGLKVI